MDLDPLVQEELEETTATLDVLSEGDEEPDGLLQVFMLCFIFLVG